MSEAQSPVINTRKSSLSRDYIVMLCLVVFISFSGGAALVWRSMENASQIIIRELQQVSFSLNQSFSYVFDYTDMMLEHMAMGLGQKGWDDHAEIHKMLSQFRLNYEMGIVVSWDTLSWLDRSQKMLVNNTAGNSANVHTPEFISVYPVLRSITDPRYMHLSKPLLNPIGHEKMIPISMCLINGQDEYVCSILLGLSLKGLPLRLSSQLKNDGVSYVITDRQGSVILRSSQAAVNLIEDYLPKLQLKLDESTKVMQLRQHWFVPEYLYYKTIDNYPYSVIVAYDPDKVRQIFWNNVGPRIVEFVCLTLLLIAILLLMQRRVVFPIAKLSKAAAQLVQGIPNPDLELPSYQHREIQALAEHIRYMGIMMAELGKTREELAIKSYAAESASRAKSEFLACVSHELRTPLNAIIGYSEMIHGQVVGKIDNDQYVEYAAIIHNSGLHLLKIISDILDIANAKSGLMQVKLRPIDATKVIKQVLELVDEWVQDKQLQIRVQLSEDLPMVQADAMRLKQAIRNLLINAIKFSPNGEKILIHTSVEVEDGVPQFVNLHIDDCGIGMHPEDIERALHPFSQLDGTMSRNYDGIGLGLPIANKLINLQNGSLSVESALYKGTKVTIRLAVAEL